MIVRTFGRHPRPLTVNGHEVSKTYATGDRLKQPVTHYEEGDEELGNDIESIVQRLDDRSPCRKDEADTEEKDVILQCLHRKLESRVNKESCGWKSGSSITQRQTYNHNSPFIIPRK